jgi:RNA polymerase sigma-70 factor, ECF subfamily
MGDQPHRPVDVARTVAAVYEQEWAFVLAATARVAADLDLAEECAQDAFAQALVSWPNGGIPARPGAWLTTVARRRAIEVRRREATLARKIPLLVTDLQITEEMPLDDQSIPDDRLRLIFTCCHPALSREAQVALTLRLVCGLSSPEVARAFLVKEATMQARITRAKRKIAEVRIPYRVPEEGDLPERVGAVLDVIHLVYSAGHTAGSGGALFRGDLAARGVALARMLHMLLPDDSEVTGLLALLCLTESRRPARLGPHGELMLLADQDRHAWDRVAIAEGIELVHMALAHPPAGRFALMSAIAAVHAEARRWEDTDWRQVVGLYDLLLDRWPSPVVALNRAVAVSFVDGPACGLAAVDQLGHDPLLVGYSYLAATRADLLRRLGRIDEAVGAYKEALQLTNNGAEAAFLRSRLSDLRSQELMQDEST